MSTIYSGVFDGSRRLACLRSFVIESLFKIQGLLVPGEYPWNHTVPLVDPPLLRVPFQLLSYQPTGEIN